MLTVWVTRGIPASGKSTWAKDRIKTGKGQTVRVNRDDLRTMLNVDPWSKESFGNEDLANSLRDKAIIKALEMGKDVIVDETNVNGKVYKQICKMIQDRRITGVWVVEKPFYVDLETALERDKARSPQVGENVIREFWERSGGTSFAQVKERVKEFPSEGEAKKREPIVYDPTLLEAILCDLDGTLALFGDRNPYDRDFENDWPNLPVLTTISLYREDGVEIIFCSGREERHREVTDKFLRRVWGSDYKLFMRPNGDYRKDTIVKEELFDANIRGKFNILLALDDRDCVVKMYRDLGLTVFQVAPGDF